MARRSKSNISFTKKFEEYADGILNDHQKVTIAKRKFLQENKDEILKAANEHYPYYILAEFATIALMETDISKSYIVKDKEDSEVEIQTQFTGVEIKNFCEVEKV